MRDTEASWVEVGHPVPENIGPAARVTTEPLCSSVTTRRKSRTPGKVFGSGTRGAKFTKRSSHLLFSFL